MARLLIGKSDSSCSRCVTGGANGTETHHNKIVATRWDPKTKVLTRTEIAGCGEEWDGMQTTYMYPSSDWEEWVKKPSDWNLSRFPHFIGKPCYDAFGKFVGNFAEGVDTQPYLPLD